MIAIITPRPGVQPLIVLALDTSTPRAALALARADGSVVVAATDPVQRHGRGLIPAIRDLLRAAGLRVGDLEALAVGLGPGSYTGLRVGVTAAKVLAYAAGRPLVGFDSLEAIARNAPPDALRVAVVADAQRGDLFAADFRRDSAGGTLDRLAPTRVEPAGRWASALEPGTLVLGPGLDRLMLDLPDSVTLAPPELGEPLGAGLAQLALALLAAGRCDAPWFLEPVYLRRSAAEDQWDARDRSKDSP